MGHASNHGHAHTQEVLPPDAAKIKKIWLTAGILAVVTAIEFICAFTMTKGFTLTSIFVILTFVKTFYIVGEFMHLKYEVKVLIWSIMAPVIFILWFITSMLYEGNAVLNMRLWVETWFR